MDGKLYSKSAVDKYMNDNLFFNDEKLKKYYLRDWVNFGNGLRRSFQLNRSTSLYMYVSLILHVTSY